MPQGEGAFEVDEVAERHQQSVQRRPVQPGGAVGCVLQRRGPHVSRRRHRQHPLRVGDERVDHRGIELPAPPAARHRYRALDAVLPLMHLDHVGQLGDAHLDRDRVARRTGRQAAAVEAFEREAQRGLHIADSPIRSASSAADVQCEWMSCEIWPRALAYSVATVFRRDSSDSPRPTLASRKR